MSETTGKPRLLVLTSTFPRWHGDHEPAFVFELARRLTDRFAVTVLALVTAWSILIQSEETRDGLIPLLIGAAALTVKLSALPILLIAGLYVPLVLLVLAPIVLNIVLFHVFLGPADLPLPIFLLALGIYLAYAYRSSFAGVLVRKAELG